MRLAHQNRVFRPHNQGMLFSSTALFFRDFPAMGSFVLGTFELGIWRLGHLVQMREEDVYRLIPTTAVQRRIIDRQFEVSGLMFGVELVGWAAPEDLEQSRRTH